MRRAGKRAEEMVARWDDYLAVMLAVWWAVRLAVQKAETTVGLKVEWKVDRLVVKRAV